MQKTLKCILGKVHKLSLQMMEEDTMNDYSFNDPSLYSIDSMLRSKGMQARVSYVQGREM